jgi:hypothetical protein
MVALERLESGVADGIELGFDPLEGAERLLGHDAVLVEEPCVEPPGDQPIPLLSGVAGEHQHVVGEAGLVGSCHGDDQDRLGRVTDRPNVG